jgi:hypothetical protein
MISQSERQLMLLDEKKIDDWIEFAYQTSKTRAGIYASDHIVYIGTKT